MAIENRSVVSTANVSYLHHLVSVTDTSAVAVYGYK